MKKDKLAAEKYAGKHGDLFAVRASAFLAGVRYGRRNAVYAVKNTPTNDVLHDYAPYDAADFQAMAINAIQAARPLMTSPTHKELREAAERATSGPGKILYTKPAGEIKEQLLAGMKESLEKSIEHNAELPWWWIETEDGRKIADFGNGPTSQANALFWGMARDNVLSLLDEIEKVTAARDYLAAEALAALSGAKVPTPEEGYVAEPYMLLPDIGCLAHERDNLKTQLREAREAVGFLADAAKSIKEYRDACGRGESRKLSSFELQLYDMTVKALASPVVKKVLNENS